MRATCLAIGIVICATAWDVRAQDIDITKREVTDPLLKITTSTQLLPEKDDKGLSAKRNEKSTPPMYSRIFGQQNVIMLEPFSREKPAQIDFSGITSNHKGTLRIGARNHPSGDFQIEILKGGVTLKKESVGNNKWERYTIPFDHEAVVLKNFANGWNCEFAFIDYSIGTSP